MKMLSYLENYSRNCILLSVYRTTSISATTLSNGIAKLKIFLLQQIFQNKLTGIVWVNNVFDDHKLSVACHRFFTVVSIMHK